MSARDIILPLTRMVWPLTSKKVLILLGAMFVAWSWYVQPPAAIAQPQEPQVEYLFA
jgi:hypothetical protein